MPNPLRIGINALRLTPRRVDSTEVYLRNLLAALAAIDRHNIYTVFINREIKQDICPVAKNFHVVQSSITGRVHLLCLLHEQVFLPLQGMRRRLDIFFSVVFSGRSVVLFCCLACGLPLFSVVFTGRSVGRF